MSPALEICGAVVIAVIVRSLVQFSSTLHSCVLQCFIRTDQLVLGF